METIEKTSVKSMVGKAAKFRKEIDRKGTEIHHRAAEMVKTGNENMHKGIEAVESGIAAKGRDIHKRAKAMVAEGNQRMSAGIADVVYGIREQERKNHAALKEMQQKIDTLQSHIRGFERETAHYINIFYNGE